MKFLVDSLWMAAFIGSFLLAMAALVGAIILSVAVGMCNPWFLIVSVPLGIAAVAVAVTLCTELLHN